jgi:hypothetical protein
MKGKAVQGILPGRPRPFISVHPYNQEVDMMKKSMMPAVLSVLIFYCATTRVTVDYDKTADFSSYKTFSLVPPKAASAGQAGAVRDPFLKKELLNEIRPILEKKGYSEASDRDQADFLVVFYTHVQNEKDFVPAAYRVGRWGRTRMVSPGHVVRYKEGTLAIDIVDRKLNDMVWQGVGRDVLDRNDPSSTLVSAVDEILKTFPPKP